MSKLPSIPPKKVLKALIKTGFYIDRKSGSHVYLKHQNGRRTSVSIHPRPLFKGTLHKILKQTELSIEELKKLI